jgi:hypothetical protein
MTKDIPEQDINNRNELIISLELALYLNDSNSPYRLEGLKAIDKTASEKHNVNIVDLKIPFL